MSQAERGFCKMCAVYLHRAEPRAVVATMFGETQPMEGFYFEDDEAWKGDVSDLDRAARAAFEASCQRHKSAGHKDTKIADWPSFRASDSKSVRQFQTQYVRYDVRGANSANIVAIVTSQDVVREISLTASCNPQASPALGDALMRLHKYYLRWQSA